MIINCPHCQAKYEVPLSALSTQIKAFRCSSCGYSWTVQITRKGERDALSEEKANAENQTGIQSGKEIPKEGNSPRADSPKIKRKRRRTENMDADFKILRNLEEKHGFAFSRAMKESADNEQSRPLSVFEETFEKFEKAFAEKEPQSSSLSEGIPFQNDKNILQPEEKNIQTEENIPVKSIGQSAFFHAENIENAEKTTTDGGKSYVNKPQTVAASEEISDSKRAADFLADEGKTANFVILSEKKENSLPEAEKAKDKNQTGEETKSATFKKKAFIKADSVPRSVTFQINETSVSDTLSDETAQTDKDGFLHLNTRNMSDEESNIRAKEGSTLKTAASGKPTTARGNDLNPTSAGNDASIEQKETDDLAARMTPYPCELPDDEEEETDDAQMPKKPKGNILFIFFILLLGMAVLFSAPYLKPYGLKAKEKIQSWMEEAFVWAEPVGAGLELKEIVFDFNTQTPASTAFVRGKLENISDKTRQLPALLFIVTNERGAEVQRQILTFAQSELTPGQAMDFETTLKVNSLQAQKIEIRFTKEIP